MKSFSYIISSLLTENTLLKLNNTQNSETNLTALGLVYSLEQTNDTYDKFKVLSDYVVEGLFISENKREVIMQVFSKAQVVYKGFTRLARHYKVKKARKYDMQCDLLLNPLSELNESLVYDLYDDKTRTVYSFRVSDLLSIVNIALSHSPGFFSEPQKIRNPYTNINFTIAQLYSIYFYVKSRSFTMPTLFHQCFLVDFDLLEFCKRNECYIRDEAIKLFMRNASIKEKHKYIKSLFIDYQEELKGVVIHKDFPKGDLVSSFSCYLNDYLNERYSLNPTVRLYSQRKLKRKLYRFRVLNPTYGRKIHTRQFMKRPPLNNENTFIFGGTDLSGNDNDNDNNGNNNNNGNITTTPRIRVSFVKEVITELPRITNRETRQPSVSRRRINQRLQERRRTNEAFNQMFQDAFSSLRDDTETTNNSETTNNLENEQDVDSDDNEDTIIDSETGDTDDMDIDDFIHFLESDSETESDTELNID